MKNQKRIKLYNFTFVYADESEENCKISVGAMLSKVFSDPQIKKVLSADSDKSGIYTDIQCLAETAHFYRRFTEVQ